MRPVGSSRDAVRGLRASYAASTSLLNPMAALRALTMQATIQISRLHTNPSVRAARIIPTSANGSANTE
jgi:hypothetical protein